MAKKNWNLFARSAARTHVFDKAHDTFATEVIPKFQRNSKLSHSQNCDGWLENDHLKQSQTCRKIDRQAKLKSHAEVTNLAFILFSLLST